MVLLVDRGVHRIQQGHKAGRKRTNSGREKITPTPIMANPFQALSSHKAESLISNSSNGIQSTDTQLIDNQLLRLDGTRWEQIHISYLQILTG